jgi:hypothetical protein
MGHRRYDKVQLGYDIKKLDARHNQGHGLAFFSRLFFILSPSPSWDFDNLVQSPGRWLNGVQ